MAECNCVDIGIEAVMICDTPGCTAREKLLEKLWKTEVNSLIDAWLKNKRKEEYEEGKKYEEYSKETWQTLIDSSFGELLIAWDESERILEEIKEEIDKGTER